MPHTFSSQLHTSELNDGYDWGRLNLQSVTEQNSLEEFLATAELAGTEFVAGELSPNMSLNGCFPNPLMCRCFIFLLFCRETEY